MVAGKKEAALGFLLPVFLLCTYKKKSAREAGLHAYNFSFLHGRIRLTSALEWIKKGS